MQLLTKQRLAVTTDGGEIVIMQIGDSEIRMGYEAAIQLSQWLRVRGKEAKRKSGDMSRHWSAIAVPESLT